MNYTSRLFALLGEDERSHHLFQILYRLGKAPASTVATRAGMDRATTYRHLEQLVKRGILSVTHVRGVKYYLVEDEDVLFRVLNKQAKTYARAADEYDLVRGELLAMKQLSTSQPLVRVEEFPRSSNLVQDALSRILDSALRQEVHTIRMLFSQTFLEKKEGLLFSSIAQPFLDRLAAEEIRLEAYAEEGLFVREFLREIQGIEELETAAVGQGSTHVYVVGNDVFFLLFEEQIHLIRLGHPSIAQTFHFLLDRLSSVSQ